jgi:hypothetical protein
MLPAGTPRLCLFGSADTVVSPAAVEMFVASERAKGEDVTGQRFESGHVSHHLADPARYWAAMECFMAV